MPQPTAQSATDRVTNDLNACGTAAMAGCFTGLAVALGLIYLLGAITGFKSLSNAEFLPALGVSFAIAATVVVFTFRHMLHRGFEKPTAVTLPDGSVTRLQTPRTATPIRHAHRHALRPFIGGVVGLVGAMFIFALAAGLSQSGRDLAGFAAIYMILAGISAMITAGVIFFLE